MSVKVHALDHLVINVSDVARTAQWYRKILGMEIRVFDPGQGKTPRTSLIFGSQKINVRPRDGDKVEWFTADHETAGSDDLCFLTSSTPEAVVAHLTAHGVATPSFGRLCPAMTKNNCGFARGAIRWQKSAQARMRMQPAKGCRRGKCGYHSRRRASSDHSRGSTCPGYCGCGPRRAGTIRS